MSNALVVLQGQSTQLTEIEQMILEEMATDPNAFDFKPERVKIAPGGIGQWLVGEEPTKSFTAIVAISQKVRGYWPGTELGKPPLCSSPDGVRGVFARNPDPDHIQKATKAADPHPAIRLYDAGKPVPDTFGCASCPLNQFGSAHQKDDQTEGKACSESRRLLVLIDGMAYPAVVSLPVMSIKNWDGYCSGLATRKSSYFAVRTKFELDSDMSNGGQKYNKASVSAVGALSKEEITAVLEVRRQFRELVSEMPIVSDEYETTDVPAPVDDYADETPPF